MSKKREPQPGDLLVVSFQDYWQSNEISVMSDHEDPKWLKRDPTYNLQGKYIDTSPVMVGKLGKGEQVVFLEKRKGFNRIKILSRLGVVWLLPIYLKFPE